MKTLTFLSRQIQSHKTKSLSFVCVIVLIILLGYGLFWLYQNVASAVRYYSNVQIVDAHRVSFVAESNIFSLLSNGGGSLDDDDIETIENDSMLENIQSFTLIPYPVTGDFSVFSFNLESDIPVFALSGNTLDPNGVGISQRMLEYYNLQFAGSSPLFPKIDKNFILGKKVVITIGKSKLFDLGNQKSASKIETKITNIHPDYPGFGIVLPRKIVEEKMREIGLSLGNPYKIVASIKNLDDMALLREKYKHLKTTFDFDTIQKNTEQLGVLEFAFFTTFCGIILIVGTILLFLLGSILREIHHIYRLIYRLGISGYRSSIFTLGEPIVLTLIGGCIGGILTWIFFVNISKRCTELLPEKGILFPFVMPKIPQITLFIICCIVIVSIVLVYYNWRQLSVIKNQK